MNLDKTKARLLEWYSNNKRPLPWRANRDPYRIWISETMLQQTTTAAVIPYFERFTERFSTLQSLAEAPQEAVLEMWAGLGYYSRARNLHKSAQALHAAGGFSTFLRGASGVSRIWPVHRPRGEFTGFR